MKLFKRSEIEMPSDNKKLVSEFIDRIRPTYDDLSTKAGDFRNTSLFSKIPEILESITELGDKLNEANKLMGPDQQTEILKVLHDDEAARQESAEEETGQVKKEIGSASEKLNKMEALLNKPETPTPEATTGALPGGGQ